MKKLILILSLLFLSTPSFGEWKKVATTHNSEWFLDMDNIKKKSNIVYFWRILNITDNDPKWTSRSHRSYVKADCDELKFIKLQTTSWSGQMATGDLLFTYGKETDWSYPPPGSYSKDVLEIVCNY